MYELPEEPLYTHGEHLEPIKPEQLTPEFIKWLEESRPSIFEKLIPIETNNKNSKK